MLGIIARFLLQNLLDFALNFNPREIRGNFSEGIEYLIHLSLLNYRKKIQQQSSVLLFFCLMLRGAFVSIALHHTLPC